MTKSFDYGSTNRLSILQCDKIYNKLGNKLQSLNIPTCEVNIISKIKLQNYSEKSNFKNTKKFKKFTSKQNDKICLPFTQKKSTP